MSLSLIHIYCFRVLCDYRNLLRRWKLDYAPNTPDEDFHPLFVESLQKQDYVDYLLDTLLSPDMEERAALIASYGKEVRTIERRMAELEAGTAAGRRTDPVSYTHLDVYKRQLKNLPLLCCGSL